MYFYVGMLLKIYTAWKHLENCLRQNSEVVMHSLMIGTYVHVCQSLFLDWIRQKCLRNKYIHKSNRILKTLSTQYCTLLTKNGRLKIKTTFIWLLLWLICSFLVLHFGIILCTLCIFYSGFIRIWTVFFLYIVCLLCGLKLASEWWLS